MYKQTTQSAPNSRINSSHLSEVFILLSDGLTTRQAIDEISVAQSFTEYEETMLTEMVAMYFENALN